MVSSISGTLTNSITAPVTATYVVTPVAGSCTGADFNVTVLVNPIPTLAGASQQATVCEGSGATILLSGLLPSTSLNVDYTINGVPQTEITGVPSDINGDASFTSATLSYANNGQTLQITGITVPSAEPNCPQTFTQNITLSVNPMPTLAGASLSSAYTCAGSGAGINLTGLLANSTSTINYTIDGVPHSVTGVVANGSGAGSFTSAALTDANNGKALVITGITTTSGSLPNCTQAFSTSVTLSVAPRPTAAITSLNTNLCSPGTTDITMNITATGSWTLTFSNLENFNGSGSGTFSYPASPTSTTTYAVQSMSDGVCAAATSDLSGSTLVTVYIRPQLIVNDPAEVCAPAVVDLTLGAVTLGGQYPTGTVFSYWTDIDATSGFTKSKCCYRWRNLLHQGNQWSCM